MKNEGTIFGSILNDMSDGLLVIGFDGSIRLHNPAAAAILGLPENALDMSIADLVQQAGENDALFADLQKAVEQKKKTVKTVPYFRDDDMYYLRITADILCSEGEQIGIVAQITDITEATMLFIANKRLANQVTNLMNSFVEVMVTAIEEKSSYNANHTKSMVRYAKRYLAWLEQKGTLSQFTSENTAPLLMSIWLHDIGKLLVPPEVMDKPTRLGSAEKDIRHRIETARLMLQIKALKYPESSAEFQLQSERLEKAEALIFTANTAGFLEDDVREQLREAAKIQCFAADGSTVSLLDENELEAITVQRGTLTADERKIIEAHVSWTGTLLSKVEFRGDYKPVPKWAVGHHELLDGSGYPDHLTEGSIPWETRLLTIIDVYDALTAEDRPYKPPLPPEKAFAILTDMAEHGKIDKQILESFLVSEAWKRETTNN
ncbi:MAG: PAS domain S-box protein [Ruminococcus sp.]|nr:PAS domain S-box protein [Ruminococcus sp.]